MKKLLAILLSMLMPAALAACGFINGPGSEDPGITHYSDGSWSESEYDDDGNRISYSRHKADGTLMRRDEHEYNADGNLIKEVQRYADGSGTEFGYDDEGRRIMYALLYADGSAHRSEFDDDGNLIKESLYGPGGSLRTWYEYEYDEYGRIIKTTEFAPDGTVIGSSDGSED
jgi:YD repeat-containing protein